MPKNNQEFWVKKLGGNKDTDKLANRGLRKMGWEPVLSLSKHGPRVGTQVESPKEGGGEGAKGSNR